jgi:hypothetical protein
MRSPGQRSGAFPHQAGYFPFFVIFFFAGAFFAAFFAAFFFAITTSGREWNRRPLWPGGNAESGLALQLEGRPESGAAREGWSRLLSRS